MGEIFREFPTHGKLALEIKQAGLTLPQIAITANVIQCPMQATSRAILLGYCRRRPFKLPVTQYQITDARRGRSKCLQLFSAGLSLMGATPEDYLDGRVPANRLSFAIWVASVSKMPELLADVSAGLQQGYKCPISVNKLSDYINGHRPLMRTLAHNLLRRCLDELGTEPKQEQWVQGSLFDWANRGQVTKTRTKTR